MNAPAVPFAPKRPRGRPTGSTKYSDSALYFADAQQRRAVDVAREQGKNPQEVLRARTEAYRRALAEFGAFEPTEDELADVIDGKITLEALRERHGIPYVVPGTDQARKMFADHESKRLNLPRKALDPRKRPPKGNAETWEAYWKREILGTVLAVDGVVPPGTLVPGVMMRARKMPADPEYDFPGCDKGFSGDWRAAVRVLVEDYQRKDAERTEAMEDTKRPEAERTVFHQDRSRMRKDARSVVADLLRTPPQLAPPLAAAVLAKVLRKFSSYLLEP